MRETAFCYWSKKQTIYLKFSWQHGILTFSKLYDNLRYQRRFKSLQDSRSMITFTSFITGFIYYMNQSIGNWIFLLKTKPEWKYEFSFLKESAKSVTHKSFQNFINIREQIYCSIQDRRNGFQSGGILKSIAGQHGWPKRKIFEF